MVNLLSHLSLADASGLVTSGVTAACGSSCNSGTTVPGVLNGVVSVLIFLIGAVSVIMIVVGGLRFVLSNGDSKAAESGRQTILYAVIGLVVAIAAYAIVKFVIVHIK
ncbi:MAG TPA: hypothetical protein VLI05_06025 [Candidatus Saccharimonadia bacterium]|nr:hypothetical protein [Candidatus Saccharimonadia bacterium]